MLYELLTGSVPFQGPTYAVLAQALHSPPESPRKRNPAVDAAPRNDLPDGAGEKAGRPSREHGRLRPGSDRGGASRPARRRPRRGGRPVLGDRGTADGKRPRGGQDPPATAADRLAPSLTHTRAAPDSPGGGPRADRRPGRAPRAVARRGAGRAGGCNAGRDQGRANRAGSRSPFSRRRSRRPS